MYGMESFEDVRAGLELRRLTRRQRSGEFAHRREAELARDEAVRTASRGLRRQVLAGTGEFLISCGSKLRSWGGADVPATFRAR